MAIVFVKIKASILILRQPYSMAKRYAVVTGGNKGIGFEICRQLASSGIVVILTARDQNRGLEAVQKLKNEDPSLSHHIVFHQLDVTNSCSISSLADFIQTQFGKLDILVNNAGVIGAIWRQDVLKTVALDERTGSRGSTDLVTNDYELAEECVKTNYYGSKLMLESMLPLLGKSDSARVVNVSSWAGKLKLLKNEWAKGVLSDDVENITEERVEQVMEEMMKDFKEGVAVLETKGWPPTCTAYIVTKACLNAYTRIAAKRFPKLCINSVCPGVVKTDMNLNTGTRLPAQGAEGPVMLALLPDGGPSGRFFDRTGEATF